MTPGTRRRVASAVAAATRPVLVLQHEAWEHPGLITTALADLPTVTVTALDEAVDALGRADLLGGVVVMGGPMGALDDDTHPGLRHERRLLAEAVAAGVPVLGVCLGMQLLGVALGGALTPGATREIGLGPLELTPQGAVDPVLAPLVRGHGGGGAGAGPVTGTGTTVLHWHGDVVSLPPGATLLASTPTTPVQAFRLGSAVGLQFHLEVDGAHLDEWLATPEMTADLTTGEAERIREDGRRVLPALAAAAHEGFASFAATMRARRG